MLFQNKTALVTGASRGIGRAIAHDLAQNGARVIVNYVKNEDAARQIVAEIEAAGGAALAIQGDVSKIESIDELFAQIEKTVGKIDILVNNAGFGAFVPFDEMTPEHFDEQFDLNVRGLFFTTQRSLRIMNDGGRIVNISSIASRGFSGNAAVYAATKAAVNTFTTALSKDVGARGITVNCVSPGPVKTELFDQAFGEEEQKRMASNSVFNRLGDVGDIADVVTFLCSENARWITGREIVADGGVI